MRCRGDDLLYDWLVRDFEPDLAARFYPAVSATRREQTAALLGLDGRRVSASGRSGLGKPVRGRERTAGRGTTLGLGRGPRVWVWFSRSGLRFHGAPFTLSGEQGFRRDNPPSV
ncbi:hypothetical protein HispidOSU_018479 [Sigmodon hispidus]